MTEQLTLYDAQVIGAPHNGTSTSIAAAVAAGPKVSPQKRRILSLLWPALCLTQDEVSEILNLPRSTVCARMRELELEGLIEKNGNTRPTRYGRQSAVYQCTSNAEAIGREPPQ